MKNYETFENCNLFNEDIKNIAYYLVSLYYKTGCKYMCSRAKINRLLTIYMFCTIEYNCDILKNEYIISNPNDRIGLWFPILAGYFCKDVYTNLYLKKQECKEITDEFNNDVEIPKRYRVDEQVSDNTKIVLEIIFRKFGNYSLNDLGPMVDNIVLKMPIKEVNNKIEIDNNNFWKFLNTNLDNEVFNFIKNFNLQEQEKNNKVKKKKTM